MPFKLEDGSARQSSYGSLRLVKEFMQEIVVVGARLSGISAVYYLKQKNKCPCCGGYIEVLDTFADRATTKSMFYSCSTF